MAKKRIAKAEAKPLFDLFAGDSVQFMRQWAAALRTGKAEAPAPKLMIADPPYNFGQDYDSYHDDKSSIEYLSWTQQWLAAAYDLLDPYGSLWVFIPDEWVADVEVLSRSVGPKMRFYKRRHIIWTFTFGQAMQKNFSRSHQHILYLTKAKTRFYADDSAIRVPSARQLKYNDKRARAGGKMPDATWMLLREQMEEVLTPDQDVWLESRICGTFKERAKHSPNQLPVPLLQRIVDFAAPRGSVVYDPFCGTGATGVAALRHGCYFVGSDLSKTAITRTRSRLQSCSVGQA